MEPNQFNLHCARKEVRGAARTEIPSQEKGYGGANAELKIGGIRMTIGQRIYQIRTWTLTGGI